MEHGEERRGDVRAGRDTDDGHHGLVVYGQRFGEDAGEYGGGGGQASGEEGIDQWGIDRGGDQCVGVVVFREERGRTGLLVILLGLVAGWATAGFLVL